MTASFTTRRILCTVLAATIVALPSNSALAGPAATTTKPPATTTSPTTGTAPASTPPATGTAPTSTPPAGTPPAGTPPASGTPTDGTTPPAGTPTDGTTPPADGTTPPTDVATNPDGTPVEGTPPEGTPVEPKPEDVKPEEPVTPPPVVPEGPERPAEPTLGNGKYKAKGTGLMIAGGTLFGVGIAGVITTYFLTRCPDTDLENNFACKNRDHNTFAVPATVSLALLGAVLLLVGAGYNVRYKRWERWTPEAAAKKKTAITPTFLRGGAGVSYTVKF
jgi:hypothetical protein